MPTEPNNDALAALPLEELLNVFDHTIEAKGYTGSGPLFREIKRRLRSAPPATSAEGEKENESWKFYAQNLEQEIARLKSTAPSSDGTVLAAEKLRSDLLQAEVKRWVKWREEQPWLAEIHGYQDQVAAMRKEIDALKAAPVQSTTTTEGTERKDRIIDEELRRREECWHEVNQTEYGGGAPGEDLADAIRWMRLEIERLSAPPPTGKETPAGNAVPLDGRTGGLLAQMQSDLADRPGGKETPASEGKVDHSEYVRVCQEASNLNGLYMNECREKQAVMKLLHESQDLRRELECKLEALEPDAAAEELPFPNWPILTDEQKTAINALLVNWGKPPAPQQPENNPHLFLYFSRDRGHWTLQEPRGFICEFGDYRKDNHVTAKAWADKMLKALTSRPAAGEAREGSADK